MYKKKSMTLSSNFNKQAIKETNSEKIEKFESSFVKDFYSSQSLSFSNTRYKPWPLIEKFISENFQSKKLINVLDSGCGNMRNSLYKHMICTDSSKNLLSLSHNRNLNKIMQDIKINIFRKNTFDYIFSIAVIHHLRNPVDRKKALQNYKEILKENGEMLIYVWAYEKVKDKKKFVKCKDKIKGESFHERDYFCDWKNSGNLRYYFLYEKEEFKKILLDVGFVIKDIGIEQESIYAIVKNNNT